MRYVQFYKLHASHLSEKMGSDGVMPLDGRLGMARMKAAAVDQAHKLKPVAPDIAAYRIMAGASYSRSWPVSPIIMLTEETV